MTKEKILFLVVVAVLAALMFLGGGGSESQSGPTRGRGPRAPRSAGLEVVAPLELSGRFLPADSVTWGQGSNDLNPFLAPRETTPLEPVTLPTPPFPRLPHPGLPLVPTVAGAARVTRRRIVEADPSIVLPPPAASVRAAEAAESDEGGDPEVAVVDDGAAAVPEGPVTLTQLLSLSTLELLALRQKEAERRAPSSAAIKARDRVRWPSGRVSEGALGVLDPGMTLPEIKCRIDDLRADTTLAERERKDALSKLRFVFREARSGGRPESRSILDGSQVEGLDLEDTAVNRFALRRIDLSRRGKQNDAEAQLALLRDVVAAGELDLAVTAAVVLAKSTTDVRLYELLVDVQRRRFDYGEAFRWLETGLTHHVDHVGLQARRGQLLLRLGITGGAETSFRAVLEKRPGDARASLGLGEVLLRGGDVSVALPLLRQAEGAVDIDAEQRRHARLLLGEANLAKGDLSGADSWFGVVLESAPNDPEALAGRAAALLGGRANEALAMLESARKQRQFDGRLAYLHGIALLEAGKWVEGRDLLLLVPELDPLLTGKSRVAISFLLEKVGQDEAALAEVDAALVADPEDVDARMQRGRLLLHVGDLEGSRREFLMVLRAEPDRPDALAGLGDLSFRRGQFEDALRYYDRVAKVEPSFPDLRGRRIICRARGDRLSRAQELLAELSTAELADPFLQAASGYVQYRRGNADESLRVFRKLVEKAVGSVELRAFAQGSAQAIEDNLSKTRWRDEFNRTGTALLKGWEREIGSGINVALAERALLFQGRQQRKSYRPTIVYQRRPGRGFASFSARLTAEPAPGVFVGVGLAALSRGAVSDEWDGFVEIGGTTIQQGLQVALSPEQGIVRRFIRKGKAEDWTPLEGANFTGGSATISLEFLDRQKGKIEVRVDGKPVGEPLEFPELTRWQRDLDLQLFAQAAIDQAVKLVVDDVEIITENRENR